MGVGYHSVTFAFARFERGSSYPQTLAELMQTASAPFFVQVVRIFPSLTLLSLFLCAQWLILCFSCLRDFSVALVSFKARALAEATVQLAASTGSEAIA